MNSVIHSDPSALSILRFSGVDSSDFLHNQVSADVLGLTDGQAVFACYCEPKGRVLSLMLIYRSEGLVYAVMSTSLTDTVVKRLRIYVMRSDVTIDVLGPASFLAAHKEDQAQETNGMLEIGDSPFNAIVSLLDQTDSGQNQGCKYDELKQGIAWLDEETSGQFLPQMLGFERIGAVNFRKGCYPGQEIIARIHYLGKVKRHPRTLNDAGPLQATPMQKIALKSDGEEFDAVVVDSAVNEQQETVLLVVTRLEPDKLTEGFELTA